MRKISTLESVLGHRFLYQFPFRQHSTIAVDCVWWLRVSMEYNGKGRVWFATVSYGELGTEGDVKSGHIAITKIRSFELGSDVAGGINRK